MLILVREVLQDLTGTDTIFECSSNALILFLLCQLLLSARKQTVRIDWGAYPHFQAPEVFAPFVLDGRHLYYINAFENAASTMETSAVAAENVARLVLARLLGKTDCSVVTNSHDSPSNVHPHSDL